MRSTTCLLVRAQEAPNCQSASYHTIHILLDLAAGMSALQVYTLYESKLMKFLCIHQWPFTPS